ncbi:tape measure protein [Desulfovibrio sulfodismutans]|uniref:Tape measure protein n=1 Tax=Desulfolutivibrio sulfodismutans TaxID=63561 RepID=A0A7K3NJF1_9BACT|nr:tape measure protein [Desulfolutivibrio sulfodismutans]
MANDFLLSILIQAKDAASQTVKAVGEAVRSLGGEAAAATKGVGGLDTATAEASGSVSRLGLSVGLWTEAVNAGVNAARSFITELRNFVVGVVNTTDRFEGLTNALDTITKGRGAETFKELNDWAKKMPLSTEEAIQAYIRLKAMGLDPTLETMTTLVDTTGALGGSVDIFNRITLALGQAATKGRLMGEEVRQFAEAGIPIYDILREKLQLTQEQMRQIGLEGIDAFTAIPAIIEGMAERFGGQASKMQQQWSGLMETLGSIWKDFARQIGDAGFLDYLKQKARDVQTALEEMAETGELQAWAQTISSLLVGVADTISVVAGFVTEFSDVWAALLVALAVSRITAATTALLGLGKALAAFSLANPVLAALALALGTVYAAMELFQDRSRETAQAMGESRKAALDNVAALQDLEGRLLRTAAGSEEHAAAEMELAKVLPAANLALDERGRVLARAASAEDENLIKLRELIALREQEADMLLVTHIEAQARAYQNAAVWLETYSRNMREMYGIGQEEARSFYQEVLLGMNKLFGVYDADVQAGEKKRNEMSKTRAGYLELLKSAEKAGMSVDDLARSLDRVGASDGVKEEVLNSYRQLVGVLDDAGQAAQRQAQVAESAGAQAYDRMAQKAQDTYSKKAEAARTAHNAEVENIGKLKLTEDEEAAKRLAADGAFHSSRLAAARAHYQTLADQLAGFFSRGEITQTEYQSRLGALERQYNTEYGAILAERQELLRVRLAEAEKAYDTHLAKINSLENSLLADDMRRESALADIRQRGMDGAAKDRDNLARVNQLLSSSEESLAKATGLSGKEREQALEQARMYAEQAAGLSGRLSDASQATDAVNRSFDQLSKVKVTSLSDLEDDAAASKQNLESLRAEMGNITATIKALADQTVTLTLDPGITEKVAGLRQDLEAAAEDVTITVVADTETAKTNIAALNEIETTSPHTVKDNATDVLAEIRSLDGQNTESTHTIYVQRVEAAAAGGLIGEVARFAAGGWHRVAGLLPGYGGGDRRPAILEDGEFVVNKSTVRLFGPDLFYALQDAARSGLGALRDQVRGALRVPGFSLGGLASARIREATRPVLSLATGGLVPASATAATMPDLGRVVLEIGGADVPAYMSADMLENLESALRRAKLTRKL